ISMKTMLDSWFHDRHVETVRCVHVENPAKDPYVRYEVIHETAFEPAPLGMGRVEVWLTKSGEISVGFETMDRVAQRLSVKSSKSGFASGHEPQRISKEGLLAVLDLVANGGIALHATILPLIGISRVMAYASAESLVHLANAGYRATQWLNATGEHPDNRSLLKYRAWT
ncbi:MAG TPA: hypothetical protein VNY82_01895, partial [Steroidobacteraceae bacterium]|nr:hypothetical protein [Steroidobacteraceae bacterium]